MSNEHDEHGMHGGQGGRARADEQVGHLEKLGEGLAVLGFASEVVRTTDRPPSLRVVNRACPALSESVLCQRSRDGAWAYWWAWGEPIAPIADVDHAVEYVALVLASAQA